MDYFAPFELEELKKLKDKDRKETIRGERWRMVNIRDAYLKHQETHVDTISNSFSKLWDTHTKPLEVPFQMVLFGLPADGKSSFVWATENAENGWSVHVRLSIGKSTGTQTEDIFPLAIPASVSIQGCWKRIFLCG